MGCAAALRLSTRLRLLALGMVFAGVDARVAIGVAAPADGGAGALLQRIDGALEDYRLSEFYAASRQFLARHADHPEADRVRYALALQLITENLRSPVSEQAQEARALLEVQAARAQTVERRFEAELLLLKFAPEAERPRRAEAMLARYQGNPKLDQVYFWLVEQALLAKDVRGAAAHAQALLERYPKTEDADSYRRIIRRAKLLGHPAPWSAEERKRLAAKIKGKVALIDFWATWCAPCVAELPRIEALHRAHAPRGLAVIGVSLDDDEEAYRSFLAEHHPPWPVIRAGTAAGATADRFGVSELPAYVLLDREGKIIGTELRGDGLEREIVTRLGSKPPKRPKRGR